MTGFPEHLIEGYRTFSSQRLPTEQTRYRELMDDAAELDRLLAFGAEQARAVSQPKVDEMKRIMGLVVPG